MRNVRLTIEYEGTNYAGWQWQKNAISIQETLIRAVRTVIREEVEIHGAGRTDAGVHALGQVANFKTYSAIPAKQLLRAINFYLPHDITSFTTKALDDKDRIRTIKNLEIQKEGKYIYFVVEADGFLYKMVRTIVGTLLEIGRGKMDEIGR